MELFKPRRLSSDVRRAQILDAAKSCFARHGFAGTTTKSVAAAAGISEGLLFRHFPTKAALYAAILSEACEADPALVRLQTLGPSTETLVVLIRQMVAHFLRHETADLDRRQRLRLMITSHLDDGEFARLLYEKIGELIGPVFTASLERAIAAGDAVRVGEDAAQPVLVRASHRADGGADRAAGGADIVLRQRRRSRAAGLRIHSARHRTQRSRNCFSSGPASPTSGER